MLELRLLGPPSVVLDGEVMTGRAMQRRRVALLSFLARAPGHASSRDKLLALLWPEADATRGRHLLSGALYDLRQTLGPERLVSMGDNVALCLRETWVDAIAFEAACEEGRVEEALRLWEGPLLDGFHLSGAPEFEHWLDSERGCLNLLWREALEEAACRREAAGDVRSALKAWQRLTEADPCSGRATLGFVEALASAGERAEALRFASRHAALLREEFGLELHPDVKAATERLRTEPKTAIARAETSDPPSTPRPAEPALNAVSGALPTPRRSPELPLMRKPPRSALPHPLGVMITALLGWVLGPRGGSRESPVATRPAGVRVLPLRGRAWPAVIVLGLLAAGIWMAAVPGKGSPEPSQILLLYPRLLDDRPVDLAAAEALWMELGVALASKAPGRVRIMAGVQSYPELLRLLSAVGTDHGAGPTNADVVLEGQFHGRPGSTRLILRLMNVEDGRLLWSTGIDIAPTDDPDRIAERLASAMARALEEKD